MTDRFVIRPDSRGFSVVDLWSGEPAKVALTPQCGLSAGDADHMAGLLNQRAAGEGRDAAPGPRAAKA